MINKHEIIFPFWLKTRGTFNPEQSETGENKMHAETVLFSLVVCFAKSRWKRNKHLFLSLSILMFYVS